MKGKKKSGTSKRHPRWKAPSPESVISRQVYDPEELQKRSSPSDQEIFGHEIAWKLRDRALGGDVMAVEALVMQARHFVRALNSLAQAKPELLKSIARSAATWPTMHSRSPLVAKMNDQMFSEIELGAAMGAAGLDMTAVSSGNSRPKKWAACLLDFIFYLRGVTGQIRRLRPLLEPLDNGRDSVTIRGTDLSDLNAFIVLVESNEEWPLPYQKHTEELAEKCYKLPPLAGNDEDAISQWWSVGYELLMLNTDGHPEKIPDLYAIGQNRKTHVSALNVDGPDDVYMPGSVDANIRGKILTDLNEEFGRMARQLTKAKGSETEEKQKSEQA